MSRVDVKMIVAWLLYGQKRNWGGNKFPDQNMPWIEQTDKNSIFIPPTLFIEYWVELGIGYDI